jgi:hypothetical protein
MKSSRIFSLVPCLLLAYAALPSASGAGTINVKTNAPGAKGISTNPEPAALPVPVSVFDLTANPTKDPFFPNSTRSPFPKNQPKTPIGVSLTSFHLGGMSGPPESRLAIVNHRTMGLGETTEVPIPLGGKVTIRIVQFKEDSVIIRVVTPPQPDLIELSLSKRAQ